jgi:hypothetical protein
MTETIIGTGTDEDVLTFLDFEHEIPCEDLINYKNCEQAAEHKLVTSCCGTPHLVCTDCLIDIKRILREDEGQNLLCASCSSAIVLGPDFLIYMGRIKP